MQCANKTHQNELLRVLKWVLTSKTKALYLKPNNNSDLELKGICDASFAPELETCRSVTGYVVFLNNAPIDWKSRGQKHVTLSSCESEYVALSEVVRVLLEAKQIIECLGFEVKLHIPVYVDNVAAIYIARNNIGRTTTHHVNVCYHFVCDLVADGTIEILFIKNHLNTSDIFTQNCEKGDFTTHESTRVKEIPPELLQAKPSKTTNDVQ